MKRLVKYVFVTIIFSFIFNIYVNAECSYKERTDLLNAAKSVDVSLEVKEKNIEEESENPNSGEIEIIKKIKYYFTFNMVGLTNDIYAIITNDYNSDEIVVNSSDLKDGIYSFDIENSSKIIKYTIAYYSNNNNCLANQVTTKTLKKPKENPIYYFSICSDEFIKENKYCDQFIEKEFDKNENQILNYLSDLKRENEKNIKDDSFIDNVLEKIKEYWYIPTFIVGGILIVFTLYLINKKRGQL